MTIIGAIARPQLDPETVRRVAIAAEAAGLDELWVWEDAGFEGGIAQCGVILGSTERLKVGVGVLPFPFRAVTLAAMEIATLDRMFPGRFIAGLGHGVQQWMRRSGVGVRSPITLEREYIHALRLLLDGGEVTVRGEYVTLDAVALEWPPAAIPALHLAATGPKSLAVSGEIGDGTILTSDTLLDDMPRITQLLARGREQSGRDSAGEVTVFVAAVAGDADAAIASARAWAAAGADRVVFEPAADEADPVGFVEFIAREVRLG